MNPKRRLVKILLYVLLLLAMGGLWGFGQYFFYPWEGDYEGDVASLIPRDVDYYLAKAELREDFDPFPRPRFVDGLFASKSGKALQRDAAYHDFMAGLDLEATLQELDRVLAQLPIEVDPLSVAGGRDLAVAGYFKGNTLETSEWAVYARINWMGKLAFGVVQNEIGLAEQGLAVEPILYEEEPAGISLSGGQLSQPVHLARIQDVLVIASTPTFIAKAAELVIKKGADSLLQSAKYFDHIEKREGQGDELELYLDYRDLAESMRLPGNWPEANSKEFGTSLAGKFFQLASIREAAGTIGFGSNVRIDLTSDLSSNVLTSTQKSFFREQDFERDDMFEVARWMPADTGLMLYGHVDVSTVLREAVASAEPDLIANMEDVVRSVWGYADVYPLIDDLASSLRDRFALCMRNFDYPEEADGAPRPNRDVVPAWAVILWVEDEDELRKIRDKIQSHQREFGLQGRNPGDSGILTLTRGGLMYEYWNPLIPSSGHIATLDDTGRAKYLLISNENRMLYEMYQTYHNGGASNPRLSEHYAFKAWVNAGLPNANLIGWWNPAAMGETLRKMARAEGALGALDIDWASERPRIEREVLQRDFPGQSLEAMGGADRQRYEGLVQAEVDRFQAEYEQENAGSLGDEAAAGVDLLELTDGTLIQIGLDPKQIKLHARIGLAFASDG